MRTVWKVVQRIDALTVSATNLHTLPEGAEFVHAAEQGGHVAMWFEVDDGAPQEERRFQVFGTGTGPIRDGLGHVCTVPLEEGRLVVHVYEDLPPDDGREGLYVGHLTDDQADWVASLVEESGVATMSEVAREVRDAAALRRRSRRA